MRIQKKTRTYSIQKDFLIPNQLEQAELIKKEINDIDKKIIMISQELLKSQVKGLQKYFFQNQSIINRIQAQWQEKQINEAQVWHRSRLGILYEERMKLQEKLDRLTGNYWKNRLKKWLTIVLLASISIFIIWIVLMGLITALYLLPIWGSIVIIYIYLKRRKRI